VSKHTACSEFDSFIVISANNLKSPASKAAFIRSIFYWETFSFSLSFINPEVSSEIFIPSVDGTSFYRLCFSP
jgi:hypothetical protein